jgi:uncharacterized protein (UPF0261 family)/ABC-type branched-subunit amino acid transport system ATPase component
MADKSTKSVLQITDLQVYYGESHALQGVTLTLESGILSVVGRNGMGKTTLCNTITGLKKARSGSVRVNGRDVLALEPHEIHRLGVGYVPQGRRVWPSLTVDEHLRLAAGNRRDAAWTVDRVYGTFPRLAERRGNGGSQLSGGEQQMLAISRALLSDPKLLIMDEPTEGLAPVIVEQVQQMLLNLGAEGDMAILVIEQNIGVATAISDRVAIMVNGQINRIMDAKTLAADRDLQQRLLGVGRHADEETAPAAVAQAQADLAEVYRVDRGNAPAFAPVTALPNRWNLPVTELRQLSIAKTATPEPKIFAIPYAERIGRTVLVAGTFDTKGVELRYMADRLKVLGIPVKTVDLSTSGKPARADIPANQIASCHPRGISHVMSGDRGASVTGMAEAFAVWIARERGIGGVLSAGGSGGTSIATAGMRALPVGIPKIMVSTVASGEVGMYVGASDIMMFHSVADVQGLNAITELVLGNAAHAIAGMVAQLPTGEAADAKRRMARTAIGLSMFGVTTPAVQAVIRALERDYDCLVFHATGTGGRSMEGLADSGLLTALIDLTTTEVADMLVGGVFAATEDRFGAAIRTGLPYVGSVGALDMVNFGPRDTVPEQFSARKFMVHNPNVTLMRTTVAENRAAGEWIGNRLNQMNGPVRFLLPLGGVSALDAPGQPFHDPEADAALYSALEATVRQTPQRQIIRVPGNINDVGFTDAVISAFRSITPIIQKRA